MNSWYYAEKQERKGPVDEATLKALAANEIVTPETLVWRQGMRNWQAFGTIAAELGEEGQAVTRGPQEQSSAPAVGVPSTQLGGSGESGTGLADHVQSIPELGDPSARSLRYAGFWIRFAALLIDSFITTILSYAIIVPLAFILAGTLIQVADSTAGETLSIASVLLLIGIAVAIPAAYFTLTTGSRMQATLGKKLLGLRVIRADGGEISYGLALGRYFGLLLSCLILYVGVIIAAYDEEKRALHDHLFETRVIER